MNAKQILILTMAVLGAGWAQPAIAATEYTPDANTALLDHFNGSTLAEHVGGALSYVSSVPGLNLAADISPTTWLRYPIGSYDWYRDPPTKAEVCAGSMEAWICPRQYGQYGALILTLQWLYTDSRPDWGWIGGISLTPDGKLNGGSWLTGDLTGSTTIPLNTWTHVDFTWGPSGSYLLVNGQLDANTPSNLYPQLWTGGNYVYVGEWGMGGYNGLLDETRLELYEIPEPATLSLLALGGLVGLRRRH